jgi:hypothetical protein
MKEASSNEFEIIPFVGVGRLPENAQRSNQQGSTSSSFGGQP